MDEAQEHKRRSHGLTIEMATLVQRCLGAVVPDRFVTWLGVSKRNGERWVAGDAPLPDPIVARMKVQAGYVEDMLAEFEDAIAYYRGKGLDDSLIKLRVREFSKTLPDTQPPKPERRRPETEPEAIVDEILDGPRF